MRCQWGLPGGIGASVFFFFFFLGGGGGGMGMAFWRGFRASWGQMARDEMECGGTFNEAFAVWRGGLGAGQSGFEVCELDIAEWRLGDGTERMDNQKGEGGFLTPRQLVPHSWALLLRRNEQQGPPS